MAYITLLYHALNPLKYHLLLLILLSSCIIILYCVLRIKIKPTVKINNFYVAYMLAGIYISFYFLLFFLLRIYQVGKNLDLKNLGTEYLSILSKFGENTLFMQLVLSLAFLILVLIWIIIFIRVKKLLEYNLWRLFFYYKNFWRLDRNKSITKEWSPYLMYRYSKFSFGTISQNIYFLVVKIAKLPESDLLLKKTRTIIKLLLLASIIIIIAYECIFSNFILYYTFHYLIVYMLLLIWMRIGLAIDEACLYLERILIERAYGFPNIIYVNLTYEEESLLELYIINTRKAIDISLETEFMYWEISEVHPIEYRCRFNRIDPESIEYRYHFNRIASESFAFFKDDLYFNKFRELYFFKKDIEVKYGKYFVNEEILN